MKGGSNNEKVNLSTLFSFVLIFIMVCGGNHAAEGGLESVSVQYEPKPELLTDTEKPV